MTEYLKNSPIMDMDSTVGWRGMGDVIEGIESWKKLNQILKIVHQYGFRFHNTTNL